MQGSDWQDVLDGWMYRPSFTFYEYKYKLMHGFKITQCLTILNQIAQKIKMSAKDLSKNALSIIV